MQAGSASSPAVNMAVPVGFGPLLRRLWVAASPVGTALSAGDVQSTLPGSVFYAEQPAIGERWAISQFLPSLQARSEAVNPAGKAVLALFSKVAIFDEPRGQGWAYVASFTPGSCPATVPAPVFSVWGLCNIGS
ncbi:MAG: hypothetical protein ACRDZX_04670 [Acidimicrobiales bacterium]